MSLIFVGYILSRINIKFAGNPKGFNSILPANEHKINTPTNGIKNDKIKKINNLIYLRK
ncbi:MAG: hypothetical protein Edafosvirus8_30 [Edafosvirus sp.]|uniref:Uncharacterized protein n=1 Tax=Edafosvirus sp. TaxID=2487765 RepID=A0A3G4ZTQ6_9VIRU|nr:MAG: hypothetical protein Edafosvirus8_30 [Edafosvirus sp.]